MRIPELDGFRAIAIVPVLAYHLIGPDRIPGGYLGVDVFFVLSGFLITRGLLAESSVSLLAFYGRRARRILPPLLVAVALAVGWGVSDLHAAAAALLFYANFVHPLGSLGALPHTWSLSIEEHFYLAWPLVFILAGRHRLAVLVAVIVGSLVARAVLTTEFPVERVYSCTAARADALGVGCVAAIIGQRFHASAMGATAAVIAMCAAFALFPLEWMTQTPGAFTAYAILCAVAILSAISAPPCAIRRVLSAPAMRYLGTRSYGIYLYHLPVYHFLDRFRAHDMVSFAVFALAKIALTLLIAEVSYRTVERWALRSQNRRHREDEQNPLKRVQVRDEGRDFT